MRAHHPARNRAAGEGQDQAAGDRGGAGFFVGKAPPADLAGPERTCSTDNPFAIPVAISHTMPGSGTTHRAEVRAIPDGLFGLEYVRDAQKLYRFFALEADRNTIPSSAPTWR